MTHVSDLITFDDYAADLKELSDRAGAAIRRVKQKVTDRDRLIFALIMKAGGEVRVSENIIHGLSDDLRLVTHYDNASKEFILKVTP